MPWLFARRSSRAAKSEEGRLIPIATKDAKSPLAEPSAQSFTQSFASPPALPRRSSRRRKRSHSATSTNSLHHAEQNPFADPVLATDEKDPFTDLPSAKKAEILRSSPNTSSGRRSKRRFEYSPHLRPSIQDQSRNQNRSRNRNHNKTSRRFRFSLQGLPTSHYTLHQGKLQPHESPHIEPASNTPARSKSRRRREHDHSREQEVRAIIQTMPKKRLAHYSSGMLQQDDKKPKGPLTQRLIRPTSIMSFPPKHSVHSSMSTCSERRAFRVSAIDMFSPRPTVLCTSRSRSCSGRTSPNSWYGQIEPPRGRRSFDTRDEKQPKRSSRIEDLADELDAGALRAIMERDKRKRDKKAKAKQERLVRKLERRAERQRAAGTGDAPARELPSTVGLGIEKYSLISMEDVEPSAPQRLAKVLDALASTVHLQDGSQSPTPLESPTEEAVVYDAEVVPPSRTEPVKQKHTRGASTVSQVPELPSNMVAEGTPIRVILRSDLFRSNSLSTVETTVSTGIPMRSASRRGSGSRQLNRFSSFFWRRKQDLSEEKRETPSEVSFSNTSRESIFRHIPISATSPVSEMPVAPMLVKKPSKSNVPKRTRSKFKEDLPEYPISPPASRLQSPGAPAKNTLAARRSRTPSELRLNSRSPSSASQPCSPVSPTSPPAGFMTPSLASVDSEASWLSGKLARRSSYTSQMRASVASTVQPQRLNQEFNRFCEELAVSEEGLFSCLTPTSESARRYTPPSIHESEDRESKDIASYFIGFAGAAGEPFAQDALSEGNEQINNVTSRQPMVVYRHGEGRVKSAEGLLAMFRDAAAGAADARLSNSFDAGATTPDSHTSDTEPTIVQRAQSVELAKHHHARHLSAGSAKLLDVKKRSSNSSHTQFVDYRIRTSADGE